MQEIATAFAILPVTLWAISTTIEKRISALTGTAITSIAVVGLGIIPMLVYFLLYPSGISAYDAAISILSGLFFSMGALLFYKALETEQVSNASGAGFTQPAIILIFSVLILHEVITNMQILGGIIAIAGVLLVITTKDTKINKKLLPVILANASWGIYWVLASTAISGSKSFIAPLLISRVSTLIILLIAFKLLFPKNKTVAKKSAIPYLLLICIAAGVIDGAGNVVFGFFVLQGLVSVASIFMTVGPLGQTALAHIFYKERLTKLQWVGMAIAITGGFILAIS